MYADNISASVISLPKIHDLFFKSLSKETTYFYTLRIRLSYFFWSKFAGVLYTNSDNY